MLCYVGDERVVAFVAGQAQLLESAITAAQDIPRADTEQRQDPAQLVLTQGLPRVFAVAIFDSALVEQGDRLATSSSSAFADQLEHRVTPVVVIRAP